MKAPEPVWECTYAHDRRAHRHRCRVCSRILEAGQRVVMTRVAGHKTIAIHAEPCSGKQHGTAAWTWRDAMRFWGVEYLRACGWTKLELPPVPQMMAAS